MGVFIFHGESQKEALFQPESLYIASQARSCCPPLKLFITLVPLKQKNMLTINLFKLTYNSHTIILLL